MQKTLTVILIIICPLLAYSQGNKKEFNWYNITQFGWLMGDNQHTYSLQTINGIAYKKYRAGLGIAFDKYGYESTPIFADLRYNLLTGRKSALQVYGNAGVNVPVRTKYLPHDYNNGVVWHTMHQSFYSEAGIDWNIVMGHRFSFIAGAGYNYKTFKYTETTYTEDAIVTKIDYNYTYHYSKYVLRVGFGF